MGKIFVSEKRFTKKFGYQQKILKNFNVLGEKDEKSNFEIWIQLNSTRKYIIANFESCIL